MGDDKAQTVLGKITPSDSNKAIEILDWLDARSIADLIIDEHPQIVALIISYLEPTTASDVLNFMPEELNIFLLEGDEDAKITRLILSSCCFLLFIFFLFF